MKVLVVLALAAVAAARSVEETPSITAYDYHKKIGIPLAAEIEKAEAELANNGRIINGNLASLGQFPYQAGLLASFAGTTGRGVCGASLVSPIRLITAAHCWSDGQSEATSFEVVLGSTLLFSGGIRLSTSNVVLHPNYFALVARNDIAIIRLLTSVQFSANISPIGLPSGADLNENYAGQTAVVSGYGLTSNDGSISNFQGLSFVQLEIITNSVCWWDYPLFLESSNICTSGISNAGAVGPCRGDSGGPLAVVKNGESVLAGVVSFGSGRGCDASRPSAYARVTEFIDFINENL